MLEMYREENTGQNSQEKAHSFSSEASLGSYRTKDKRLGLSITVLSRAVPLCITTKKEATSALHLSKPQEVDIAASVISYVHL